MDRRQLLTSMLATAFVAAIPVKAMAKLTTSASPLMKRDFHVRYDSIAMTYVKEVLGRTTPFPEVRSTDGRLMCREGWGRKPGEKYDPDAGIDWYTRPLAPDHVRAAYFLEADRRDRAYGTSAWYPNWYRWNV